MRTSLWLVPAEPVRSVLRQRISELAVELSAPGFEPHITLVSGEASNDAVAAAIESVAAVWPPLRLVAGATDHGAERFKALFVRFDDAHVHTLAAELSGRLGFAFDGAAFDPHLSLLYAAELPVDRRRDLAQRVTFAGQQLDFDTLAASRPGEERDDVARWQTTVARRLRGPGAVAQPG